MSVSYLWGAVKPPVPSQGFIMLSNEYNIFNEYVLNLNLTTVIIYLLSEDFWTFSSVYIETSMYECVAGDPKEKEWNLDMEKNEGGIRQRTHK